MRALGVLCSPALMLLLSLFIPSARADGLYIGAGGYLTDIEITAGSDEDFTPAGFLGFQFIDSSVFMASLEFGYYDLGATSARVDDQRLSVDASALTAAGVAYLPLGPFFEVYGKLGVGRIEIDSRLGDIDVGDDATEVFAGIGVAWDIFDTIDIYMEYLQFDNEIDSRMVGLGIRLDLF